ncbi:MAG: OmpA family protein [Sandaracinaceae bacterium]
MNRLIGVLLGASVLALVPVFLVIGWVGSAEDRLETMESSTITSDQPQVAVAANANEAYCTPALQQILRRVLTSCGLIGAGGGRGCQPVEARNVATMDDADFNALFVPMRERGAIVQFEQGSAELDPSAQAMIDRVYADRGGASYFFVVSRASPEGATERNRELSQQRAEAVMGHLQRRFHDPELEREVGLLWLGEEYAQLDPSFCDWTRSGAAEACSADELNRSAFVAWIDCRL